MRLFIFVLSIFPGLSWAQLDDSTILLQRSAAAEEPTGAGLESGRYKVKKPKSLPQKKVVGVEPNSNQGTQSSFVVQTVKDTAASSSPSSKAVSAERRETFSESAAPVADPGRPATRASAASASQAPTSVQASASAATTEPAVARKLAPDRNSPKSPPPSEMEKILFPSTSPIESSGTEKSSETSVTGSGAPSEIEEPSVPDQVRDALLGHPQPVIEAYREQVHPDDVRLNRIEVGVHSGIFANNSKSSHSIRDYSSLAPLLGVGAEFWLTPFVGFYGQFTTSISADVPGEAATNSRVPVRHEWTEAGLDIRKFFGLSRKANSVQFGIHLAEYKFVAPGDDLHRLQLRSTGIGLHFSTRLPVAPSYAWILGGKLVPRVQHKEIETGLQTSSGSGSESSRIEASLGGEFKLSRQNQIVWDLTSAFEKIQFQGEASTHDPATGMIPKNVSVSNTFVFLNLGYRWGQ